MKKLILLIWVMLILSLFAFSAFADTVALPENEKCEMYYDEDGVACFPASCVLNCDHFPNVGDKYVDEYGNVTGVVANMITLYTDDGKIEGYIEDVDGMLPIKHIEGETYIAP